MNLKLCESCGKERLNTKTALVNGKYYKNICAHCLGEFDDDISSGSAGYERRRGYEDNAQDTIQPYDANGKPRVEFARLYPQAALKVFGPEVMQQLKRKIWYSFKLMAQATKPRTKAAAKQTTQQPEQKQEYKQTKIHGMTPDEIAEQQDRRIGESKTHWNGKGFKLEATTKANERLYLGQQVSDDDDGEDDNLALDNRIFSSIRTVVPYVTTRITEPEVYPSSNSEAAQRFAEDFEKALHIKADKEKVKIKAKFALEDAIIRRRGYLKPRYDATTGNFCAVEYVPAEAIVVDHRAKWYEEPRYFRHCLPLSIEDLIVMFPDMKTRIYDLFEVDDDTGKEKMQAEQTINEDWVFIVDEENKLDLVVCWNYKGVGFGCIADPNWRYDAENFLDNHMMPLVAFNVLNDGRSWVDKTSFVEQAKYSQNTIDARGRQIGENAGLGSIGMPVVDAAVLADDQSQYLTYEEDTVLELAVPDGKRIQDVFDTWKAGALSADVYNDKKDAIEAVQNAFGASAIMQGNETENHTLGQDELLRDQSMGRQAEIVDAIDLAMQRLYLLMAQFLLVYGEEDELFRFVGENSKFDYIIMHSDELDTNAEIRVKSGTSMPVDNPQRRATADKAATQKMIDPLSYWEIMDEPNAEKYAKRLMDFTADPASFLKDVEEELFNRDAYVDLEILKAGGSPPYRDNLPKEYFDYLNQYVLSGDLENPRIPLETRQTISQFIDAQLARAQKMLGMAETQLPTPQDVAMHNQEVDAANAAPGAEAAAGVANSENQSPAPSPLAPQPASAP